MKGGELIEVSLILTFEENGPNNAQHSSGYSKNLEEDSE